MSFRHLMESAVWSTFAHVLDRGSLVIVSVILARNLDTSGFAAYSYFQLTVSMLAAYSSLGIGVVASRFFSEVDHVDADRLPPIGTLWVLSIVIGACAFLVMVVLPIDWLVANLDIPYFLFAAGVFAAILGVVPTGGILGLERYREASGVAAIAAFSVIAGASIASSTGSPTTAMIAFIVAALVQAVGNGLIIVRFVGMERLKISTRFARSDFRRIVNFAGPMAMVTLLAASGSWMVGRIILSKPSGQFEFQLYVIGLQWFSLALLVPAMISRVILPRVVRVRLETSPHNDARTRKVVLVGVALGLSAALGVCLFTAPISPWIWNVYGVDYSFGGWLIVAFVCAAIPSAPVNTLGNAILAQDAQWIWFLVTCVWFIALAGMAFAVAPYGAFGGAIAHAWGASLMLAVAAWVAWKRRII